MAPAGITCQMPGCFQPHSRVVTVATPCGNDGPHVEYVDVDRYVCAYHYHKVLADEARRALLRREMHSLHRSYGGR